MEVSEVKQRLLTDFFTYYPMGGALYDKNGALIDINKSLNEKFPFTNEADFLLNNLFRTDLLTDLQKQYLRGGSVVSGSLPVPYSIIPSMKENREILGYTLLLTGNPAVVGYQSLEGHCTMKKFGVILYSLLCILLFPRSKPFFRSTSL